MSSYDPSICRKFCDSTTGCQGFNIYAERDPTMIPDSKKCPNPPSSTTFKCTLWSSAFKSADAKFPGTMKGAFEIAVAASNGYLKGTAPTMIEGYAAPKSLDGAIVEPTAGTSLGSKYVPFTKEFNGKSTPQVCADTCRAITSQNYKQADDGAAVKKCSFFNAYVLSKNGVPEGLYCSFYSQQIADQYATNTGFTRGSDKYSVGQSYAYTVDEDSWSKEGKSHGKHSWRFGSGHSTSGKHNTTAHSSKIDDSDFASQIATALGSKPSAPASSVGISSAAALSSSASPVVKSAGVESKPVASASASASAPTASSGVKTSDSTAAHKDASAKPAAPVPVAQVGKFAYQGCFAEVDGEPFAKKSFSNRNNTVEACAAFCSESKYFAVEWASQCHCGDKITSSLANGSDGCDMTCPSNFTQNCGGFKALAVYEKSDDGNGFVHPTHGSFGKGKPQATGQAANATEPSAAASTLIAAMSITTSSKISSATRPAASGVREASDDAFSTYNATEGFARPSGHAHPSHSHPIHSRPSHTDEYRNATAILSEPPLASSTDSADAVNVSDDVFSSAAPASTDAAQPVPNEILFSHPSRLSAHQRPSSFSVPSAKAWTTAESREHRKPSGTISSALTAETIAADDEQSSSTTSVDVSEAEATGDSSPDFNKTKEADTLSFDDAETNSTDSREHKSFAIPSDAYYARHSFSGPRPSGRPSARPSSASVSPTADVAVDEAEASVSTSSASSTVSDSSLAKTHHTHAKPTGFDGAKTSSSTQATPSSTNDESGTSSASELADEPTEITEESAMMTSSSISFAHPTVYPSGRPSHSHAKPSGHVRPEVSSSSEPASSTSAETPIAAETDIPSADSKEADLTNDVVSESSTQQAIPTTLSKQARPSHGRPTGLLPFLHSRPAPIPTTAAAAPSQAVEASSVPSSDAEESSTRDAEEENARNETSVTSSQAMPERPQRTGYPQPPPYSHSSEAPSEASAPSSTFAPEISIQTSAPSPDTDTGSCNTLTCPANDGATCTTAAGNTVQLSCSTDLGLGNLTLTTETSYASCAAKCESQGLTGDYGKACIGFAYFPSRDLNNCYTYAHFSNHGYQITSEPFMNGMFVPYDSAELAADESSFAYKKRRGFMRW